MAVNTNSGIPDINKCNASDMNEIKNVVNTNYTEYSSTLDQVVVDYTANSDTTTINLTGLNIAPGENYKFRIVGCSTSTSTAGDIRITINNLTANQYYHTGWYYSGTLTASGTETPSYVYRPAYSYFYLGLSLRSTMTVIDGTIAIKNNIAGNRNTPFFTFNSKVIWNGFQVMSDVFAVYGQNVDSISSLQLSNVTFKAGTRIQIVKVNTGFSI